MKFFYSLILYCFIFNYSFGQEQNKLPLDHSVYDSWNTITNSSISNNGEWVTYSLTPQLGNATLKIYDNKKTGKYEVARGTEQMFTYNSQYLIYKIKPQLDSLKNQKRQKLTDDKLTKDSLGIYTLKSLEEQKIPRVQSFKIPKKWSGWVAYLKEVALPVIDTTSVDSLKTKEVKPKKAESLENGTLLVLRNLASKDEKSFPFVLEYYFAEEGEKMIFSSTGDDSTFMAGVYVYDISDEKLIHLHRSKKGKYKQLVFDKKATQAAFLSDLDTTSSRIRNHTLFHWAAANSDSALAVVDSSSANITKGWIVSENHTPLFSEDGSKLFFGTAPKPILQDTTLLPEEIVNVEVWHYKDSRLHTQQNVELEQDQKKSYLAVLHLESKKLVQLATIEIPDVTIGDEGNADQALGMSQLPYLATISWEGFPQYHDIYNINVNTGERKIIRKKVRGYPQISPKAKYIYWYSRLDSAWFTYGLNTQQTNQISNNKQVPFYNELADYPDYPGPYGVMSWLENDEAVFIYDRYDIWKFDPENKQTPTNITKNGRETKNTYRNVKLDPEERFLKNKQNLLLHTYNNIDKRHSYYSLTLGNNKSVKALLKGNHRLSYPLKSKDKNKVIFTKENFNAFPDYYSAGLDFKEVKKISDANPQQKDYLWGSVELMKWQSSDGKPLEGLLYKPENFDPNKKYPMMVYFYERYSHLLHKHYHPYPHRSIINFTFYTSRGYVVFVPDIVYKDGYPGESCYNAVLPGVSQLIGKGFIDENNIGVQGHSWGGYQSAYLVTRTNIFKAAEAGAPVSNMISAYGGIRWDSGLSRMFQYEHTQSRLGGTLWETPMRYVENSPIFYLDRVQTPLLIMHNDKDGHVPWTQGIELFVGLRRLGKPSWMLNYTGERHWPLQYQLRKDFAIRLQQYFDHFLKGAAEPKWMKKGIPAIEKSINLGYETLSNEE